MVRGGWARIAQYGLAGLVLGISAIPAHALPTQSWNGYRWARTGPLAIKLGDNVSALWKPYLTTAATQWSAANNIDFVKVAGTTTALSCGGTYGTVQVCSANYGATGWLGYTRVWLGSGFIAQATIKLNDYYFGQARYNTAAWRAQTVCHEAGHSLGLAHVDNDRTNANTGSCLDVTNDPTGLLAGYLRSNVTPGSADFAALDGIYATIDSTQLAQTRPTMLAAASFAAIGFDEIETIAAIPEPASWALMIGGFSFVGVSMRRARGVSLSVPG